MFLLKSHPFLMTLEEIGNLNMRQAIILLTEFGEMRKEKLESFKNLISKNQKTAMGVIDLTRTIYDA